MATVPTKVFLTKGVGRHREKLASFEQALRAAGIEKFNIVNVSSILPPKAKVVSRDRALPNLVPGQILYCVMSRASTNEPNRLLSASYGYISEHHAFGQKERVSGDYAEDLAAMMLASTLGIELDLDQSYDERRELYRVSDRIVRTTSITQSAVADKTGLWTTVLAAAVLLE
jgi:arginine decarboxylase